MIKYCFAHDSKFPAVLFISAKEYMEMCLGFFFYSLVDSAAQFWHKLLLFKPTGKEGKIIKDTKYVTFPNYSSTNTFSHMKHFFFPCVLIGVLRDCRNSRSIKNPKSFKCLLICHRNALWIPIKYSSMECKWLWGRKENLINQLDFYGKKFFLLNLNAIKFDSSHQSAFLKTS